MNHDARAWVFGLEAAGIKLGLAQMRALLDGLDHPEQAYPALTVAGTNGKGSVTALIEAALRSAGWRTGRYTSPHLTHIEERVSIDGQPIAPARFDLHAARVRSAAARFEHPPSFFEATTALALDAFRQEAVRIAVLEVGLGGRLDATNVVDAPLAVITPIDFDHQEYLGSTLAAIAAEKAGIIKPGAVVCLAPQPPEAARVIEQAAAARGARVVHVMEGTEVQAVVGRTGSRVSVRTPARAYHDLALRLPGRHQVVNAVTAIRALECLAAAGLPAVSSEAITSALATVVWPARLEWLRLGEAEVLLDGAHNPAGAAALASFIRETMGGRVPMVIGIMADKSVDDMLAALAPVVSRWVATTAPSTRALPAEALARACRRASPTTPVVMHPDPADAMRVAAGEGLFVVAGSLYLAGAVRPMLTSAAEAS